MMEIFNALNNPEVEDRTFIDELLKTGKFSEEARSSFHLRGSWLHLTLLHA
jgi:hypothetical protein